MFRNAVVRLTFWYLVMVMMISLFFTIIVYKVYSSELDVLVVTQDRIIQTEGYYRDPNLPVLLAERSQQISESKNHIGWSLAYFNLVILFTGGGLSYLLARRTLQPIEASLEAQSRFTSDASHELRTPLTVMRTELEVALRDDKLTLKDSKELHRSTLDEIARLEALAKSLLQLARFDRRNVKITFHQLSLHKLLLEVVERASKIAPEKNITFEFNSTEVKFWGEPHSLSELFTILMENAVKYTKPGSAIKISSRARNAWISVSIKDEGIGIKADDLPHIFDRFFRADQSRSKGNTEGYGLGLSIAKQIVLSHKGTITVRSEPDKGTRFTVRLPIRPHHIRS